MTESGCICPAAVPRRALPALPLKDRNGSLDAFRQWIATACRPRHQHGRGQSAQPGADVRGHPLGGHGGAPVRMADLLAELR